MSRIKIFLTILICIFFISSVNADEFSDITDGMEAYKNGNNEECITKMKYVVKNDPTAVVAYYYLGLAYTKTGQKLLAIQNYNKVINLNSDATMTTLARQGKNSLGLKTVSKIENQLNQIEEEIKEDSYNPILEDSGTSKPYKSSVSNNKEEAKEPQTTQVIKANEYIKPQSNPQSNNTQPTNDDIVNAIRTLQKAGLLQNGQLPNMGGMPQQMPIMDARTQQMNSMLMMMNNGNNNNNNMNMMQMMPYMNNGGKVDPQMMQMMLMNQMMPNFGGGNNNGNGY